MQDLHGFDRGLEQAGRLRRGAWVPILIGIKSRLDEHFAWDWLRRGGPRLHRDLISGSYADHEVSPHLLARVRPNSIRQAILT
jgi:hypothetical protein